MSSTHVTVAQLIAKLEEFPPDLLVAISQPLNPGEEFEGIINGPGSFEVIAVQDVRSGFNPVGFDGWIDEDWKVLLIAPWKDAPRHWTRGESEAGE